MSDEPANKKTKTTQLAKLKAVTTVLCDTGHVGAIVKFKSQDATTTLTLIYKAAKMPEYPLFRHSIRRST